MISRTRRPKARSIITPALLGSASLVALVAGSAAQGQTVAQNAPMAVAQARSEVPEQVLITGSLISGTAAVGVPVTALRAADFVETGSLSVTDILKSVPALHIDAQASPTYGGGTLSFEQNVQIHSLGTGSGVETLLLVNGLRFPPQNYTNDSVNPSIIPQIAIGRVDVLTAGASAVYGSDATAGVINIILKRGYDGAMTQLSATSSPGEGYLQLQAAQLFGKSWDNGNVTVSYTWTNARSVQGDRRSYYTMDFTPWGLHDNTSEASAVPGIVHLGPAQTIANAPALETSTLGTRFCANCFSVPQGQNGVGLTWGQISANPGVKNLRNPWADANTRPRTDWNQATIVLDQRLINDFYGFGSVALFADGFWSNQRGKEKYPAASSGPGRQNYNRNLIVPTINPYYPTGVPCVLSSGACRPLQVDFNLALDLPTIIVGGETATHWDAGLNFDSLPFGWTGKYTYSITDDKNYGDSPQSMNPQNINAALGNVVKDTTFGTGTTLTKPSSIPYLNPFCDSAQFHCQDPATLAWIQAYRLQHERWWIGEHDLTFSGPVVDLPGGPLKAAIAAQYLSEHWTYQNVSNNDTFSTQFITNLTNSAYQNSYAIFGQADIPIFGEGYTLPFVQSLLIELGYRYDRYNNLSDPVWTPKAAFNWLVGNGFTLRGAWGKSFRVPSFAENALGGATLASINPLGGATGGAGTIFTCPGGAKNAPPGTATAVLNPNCLPDQAHVQPGGLGISAGGNGATAILRGHGLSPQSLYQWSLGFNWAPTESIFGIDLSGLTADVSWFHLYFRGIIETNTFGNNDPSNPLSILEFTFAPRPDLPTNAPENAAFYNLIQQIIAAPSRFNTFDANFINNIKFIQDTALTNIGKRDFGGIDFDFRYDFDLGKIGYGNSGALNIGALGYYEVTDKSRASETSPVDSIYTSGRDSGNHLKRVRYRFGWSNETWSATLFANYFGHGQFRNGQDVTGQRLVPPCFYAPGFGPGSCFPGSPYYGPLTNWPNMTPAVLFWDVSLGYNTGEAPANPYLRNIGIQFTVNDIFNKEPPFNVGVAGGTIHAFDAAFPDLQRAFSVTLTKVW